LNIDHVIIRAVQRWAWARGGRGRMKRKGEGPWRDRLSGVLEEVQAGPAFECIESRYIEASCGSIS